MIETRIAGSPGWWFDRLASQMALRNTRIDALSAYLEGNAPLPEGAEGFREAYRAFQRKARTNLGELVVEAVQERMTVAGFRISDSLDVEANRLWSVNEMATASNDTHGDMLGLGDGYVIIGPNGDTPTLTYEDPRFVITAQDPLLPNRVIAGLKMYRDDVAGKDYAYLYLPSVVGVASRTVPSLDGTFTVDTSGFEWEREIKLPAPVVPVVRFRNRKGLGEFETHTDLLDRINYMVLQRLVIVAMAAYRQRAVTGNLPETDEDGAAIDYNAIFRPGPGALWMLPDGAELWEGQATDISSILNGAKDDIRDLAAVTRTPMSMLLPDAANQSAEGAAFAREGLVNKAKDRIQRATYGWNTVMKTALLFAGKGEVNVETEWLDPERRTLAERADAASKAVDVPWRTKMTDIWQFPPDKVDRMEAERLADALSMMIQTPAGENGGV